MKERKSEKKNKFFVNAIKCPNCGANLHSDGNSNILKCSYCESISLYKNKNGSIKINVIEEPVKIIEEEPIEENETIEEVEVKKVETNEEIDTEIEAKNIKVNWKKIKRYSAAVLAALALIPSTKFVISKFNNDKAISTKSDKTISTKYKEESRKPYSRPEFDHMNFQTKEKQAITNLSLEDYENEVLDAYYEISNYIKYKDMIKDITSAFYLVNYDYIDEELEQKLVEKGYISEESIFDENGKIDTKSSGIKNFERFNNLLNYINEYNHFEIRNAWYKGYTDLSNKLLEPSILCADKNDSEVICNLFSCWANGYNLNQNSIINNSNFHKASVMLGDLDKTSAGAKYLGKIVCGVGLYDFVNDYMNENYLSEELVKYFVPEKLRTNKWQLREDGESLDESSELSFLISSHDRLKHTCFNNPISEIIDKSRERELDKNKSLKLF